MLYKIFDSVKIALDDHNYKLANTYLEKINKAELAPKASEFYQYLQSKVPSDSQIDALSLGGYDRLSALDRQREVLPGISIVSCCMNRNENLVKSLKTWLELDVDEVIIVDWSSSTPVSESIKEYSDDRVKVLRVENESKWVLTYGFNVGLRFANYSKVFKLDADISVQPNFLESNRFSHDQFVRGHWKLALDNGDESQVYVNGSFGANKKSLRQVGYYNELIRTYGWDDSDLYERLSSECGLQTKYLKFDSLVHLEQKEEERTINQKIINGDFLGVIKPTGFNNQRNKYVGRNTDYWNTDRLQDYSIQAHGDRFFNLSRITSDIEMHQYILDNANSYAALFFLQQVRPSIISKASDHLSLSSFVFNEYEAGICFSVTEKILTGKVCFFDSRSDSYDAIVESKLNQAKESSKNISIVALGDCYDHKRLGTYGSYVELLIAPKNIIKELVSLQNLLGNDVELEHLINLPHHNFIEVFKHYSKPVVYVDAQHGLGNRLRAIGSAAAIAKSAQRELVIVWQPDHHCECEFSDLFDYDGEVITQAFVGDAYQYMDVFNYMEIEDGACKDAEIIVDNEKDLYLRAAYTFVHEASHWEAENEFIKALTPSKQVLDLIEPFNVGGYIAAHIRMEAGAGLDHNTYDSVENWTQEGHDQLHFWREKSHYSTFIKRIDQLIEQDDTLKLFLATDLQEAYDVFEKYYGDRLVYLKREIFDRSKEQILYALADVLLLSQCQKLLGSTWSSFSEAAMRLSDTYSEIEMSGVDF